MHVCRKLWFIFFLGVMPLLNLEIWPKLNTLLKRFVSATLLKPLNIISWNFVVMKDIMCRCANWKEILIQFFFAGVTANFELRNLGKIKYTTETVCQRNSSINTIYWNFVVDVDILCRCAYLLQWNLIFFLREQLELQPRYTIVTCVKPV